MMYTPHGSDPSRRFGSHLAVAATSSCPLYCAHCITRSTPTKDPEESSKQSDLFAAFLQENAFGSERVSITGGEPFYALEKTRTLIQAAVAGGLLVTVVTSCFWAKSETSAASILARLPEFDTLVISCDTYHARYVPISFVKHGYRAAKSAGLEVRIRLVQSSPPSADDLRLEHLIRGYAREDEIEKQLLIQYGRAADLGLNGTAEASSDREYCPSTGPYIEEDGAILPCCNAVVSIKGENPLKMGRITEDSATVRERFLRHVLFSTLKIEGAPRLRQILRPTLGDRVDAMSVCDLCFAVCSSRNIYNEVLGGLEDESSKLKMYAFGALKLGMSEFMPLVREAARKLV